MKYDIERLRHDLMEEYAAQSVIFSGGFGFLEMCDAEDVSEEELLKLAKEEGIKLEDYVIK